MKHSPYNDTHPSERKLIMKESLKNAAYYAAGTMLVTAGITLTAYMTLQLAQKILGPIKVKEEK